MQIYLPTTQDIPHISPSILLVEVSENCRLWSDTFSFGTRQVLCNITCPEERQIYSQSNTSPRYFVLSFVSVLTGINWKSLNELRAQSLTREEDVSRVAGVKLRLRGALLICIYLSLICILPSICNTSTTHNIYYSVSDSLFSCNSSLSITVFSSEYYCYYYTTTTFWVAKSLYCKFLQSRCCWFIVVSFGTL